MGKILNATYHDSVEKLTGFYNDLVNNSFYTLNDKKPTIVTYYNINKDYSSLDPGSKIQMDHLGTETPIRWNRIEDFIVYGFNKIELQTDNDEFGLEAEKIEGECYILPNTIVPTEGDLFEVEHITSSTWLFIVKDVQKDTLDNGSNAYKISYKLEYLNHDDVLSKVVYNFKMIEVREGTNINKIVRCEDYDIATVMDKAAVTLKKYYEELFYNDKVQSFCFMDLTEYRVYDPFMIEFLIRNKILDNGTDSYIYVTHQLPLINTFSLEYDKTFYRVFENCKKDELVSSARYASMEEIKNCYGTTFASRFETYFKANYLKLPGYNISCLDDELAFKIVDHKLQTESDYLWKNILIKYFYNEDITEEEVDSISKINFMEAKNAFYLIPLLIFCLEKAIEKVLK